MSAIEMIKQANLSLADRVKLAAAVVTINAQKDVQETLNDAAELQKIAAVKGVAVSDEEAIQATVNARAEVNMQKRAKYEEMVKQAGVADLLASRGFGMGAGGALGAGSMAGLAALLGREDPKELALAGLLGGGGGAFLGGGGIDKLKALLQALGKKGKAVAGATEEAIPGFHL